ncbi:subtilisin-like serine protease QhpE [Pseudomonas nitroreducens]|uniref:subtilisin-like serine protease QhpE n=1 Tax=Pseudomonas nitroreducens TaxID=46680 RepID=UPI0026591269|nr:S8 family serine peptidase [Pseudomonas nitroreducens]MCP1650127.1 subtilisin family serine protease [Pseudomonas nitroreducens]MCP1688004.1 subtilisin family serine protease [Pseudomonas nitroreducens]
MKPELRVGVVDSGHAVEHTGSVIGGQCFRLSDDGLDRLPLSVDLLGHGSTVCEAILSRALDARLCVAQVFDERGVTSPLQIAAALHWLGEQGVRVINLSLGVRQDRPILRDAVAELVETGVIVCASSPARGEAVFPAGYPGVIRVTGDARCGEKEWSWLDSPQADFGAAVKVAGRSGASLGCAAFSGHLAALLAERSELSNVQVIEVMRERAVFRGIERKVRL